jgi:hypothetical protein
MNPKKKGPAMRSAGGSSAERQKHSLTLLRSATMNDDARQAAAASDMVYRGGPRRNVERQMSRVEVELELYHEGA